MSRLQNLTRVEDLFPQYKSTDKHLRDVYIPQTEDKYYRNPIKEAFAEYFDALIFTKIDYKKDKDLSLYRANINSTTTATRYYVLFVREPNSGIIPMGNQINLHQLLTCQWFAFQSAESFEEDPEFNEFRPMSKKSFKPTNSFVTGLETQTFTPIESPNLLHDTVQTLKVTEDGTVYVSRTHSIQIFIASSRNLTTSETTIDKCLNTFTCIIKFTNG